MILVTGSSGLIGDRLCTALRASGRNVREFDIARRAAEDTRDPEALRRALVGVTGVVHLAAVSRVVDGQQAPDLCWATNVTALQSLLATMHGMKTPPWLIFVSSREVYGLAAQLPAAEDSPYQPLNVYARSKVEGERLVEAARQAGLIANVCRLSNVYGSIRDHANRVLPAFCRASATGGDIRVEGNGVVLDPTHVDDVAEAMLLLIEATAAGEALPPIHLVGGVGYSLPQLAAAAIAAGDRRTKFANFPPRSYDVSRFVGDPARARALLGWSATTPLETGVARLVGDYRAALVGLTATSL